MKTEIFTYGAVPATLPVPVARAFTEGESGPVAYALGVLTGYPGTPALPVVVSAGTAGVAVYGFDGYLVGTYYPLALTVPPGRAVYNAGLGLLRALPNALTVSSLTAIGFDFEGLTSLGATGPTLGALGAVRPFTALDFETYSGAYRAPNGTLPGTATAYPPGGTTPNAEIIFDAVGVEIYFFNPDLSAAALYYLHFSNGASNTGYALGATLVGGLPAALTPAYVEALGFTASPAI